MDLRGCKVAARREKVAVVKMCESLVERIDVNRKAGSFSCYVGRRNKI